MKNLSIILMSFLWIVFSASDPLNAQWIRQQVSSDATFLYTVSFLNDSVGCAVGSKAGLWSGRIVRTTNAGTSWIPAQLPDSSRSILGLQWISPATAFAAGAYNVGGIPHNQPVSFRHSRRFPAPLAYGYRDYLMLLGIDGTNSYRGIFLRSMDTGQTWFPYGTLPDSVSYVYDISFPTPSIGYAVADTAATIGGACILKTTDGGITWQKMITPDSVGMFRSVDFVDSLHGIAAGYSFKGQLVHGIIVHTTDGGSNWLGSEFTSVDNFTTASFSSEMEGYASGVSVTPLEGVVFKTTDGGTTWNPLLFAGDSASACNVSILKGTGMGFAFGNVGRGATPFAARTSDGGLSWSREMIDTLPGSPLLIGGTCLDSLNAFICGGSFSDTAVILRTSNGGVTGVIDIGKDLPSSFDLKQNYPNPFNPRTVITFSIPMGAQVSLRVYDILGEEVATLVNGSLQRGSHVAIWDGSASPSGIYFYRLQSKTYTETKKLVLLK